jgi:hypothetical protein
MTDGLTNLRRHLRITRLALVSDDAYCEALEAERDRNGRSAKAHALLPRVSACGWARRSSQCAHLDSEKAQWTLPARSVAGWASRWQ